MCYEISVEVLREDKIWQRVRGRAMPSFLVEEPGALRLIRMDREDSPDEVELPPYTWRNLTIIGEYTSDNFNMHHGGDSVEFIDNNDVVSNLDQAIILVQNSIVQIEHEIAFMNHTLDWGTGIKPEKLCVCHEDENCDCP